ncbi:MAG: hypothetical protein WEC59_06305 [Salibacteraceae bacterium]
MNGTLRNIVSSKLLLLWLFAGAMAYYFIDSKLPQLIDNRPSGIHQWRQTDGASMALMFHQEGNSLFKPMIHNQLGDDGGAGGEFPITYYAAGKLYQWFGVHEWFLRIIHFSCFFLGLMVFLYYTSDFIQPKLLALFPLVLGASSPTLMYYSVSFLTDTPAVGLAMAATGLALHALHSDRHRKGTILLSGILFILAGLLKISLLLPFFALISALLFIYLFDKTKNLYNLRNILTVFVLVLLPVAAWYIYISSYNEAHESAYFTTKITPIWNIPKAELAIITERFFNDWVEVFLPSPLRWSLIASPILVVVFFRHIPRILGLSTLFLTLGTLLYIPMFYIALGDHDYYFIAFFPAIFMLITSALIGLVNKLENDKYRWMVFGLMSILSWQAAGASVKTIKKYYHGWFNDYNVSESYYSLDRFLTEHGIDRNQKVFSPLDMSPNITLYLMNRKGWTQLTGIYDTDDLDAVIAKGATYAIVPDTSFYSITFLHYHITDTIGYHNEIGVYKIDFSPWWKGA